MLLKLEAAKLIILLICPKKVAVFFNIFIFFLLFLIFLQKKIDMSQKKFIFAASKNQKILNKIIVIFESWILEWNKYLPGWRNW